MSTWVAVQQPPLSSVLQEHSIFRTSAMLDTTRNVDPCLLLGYLTSKNK